MIIGPGLPAISGLELHHTKSAKMVKVGSHSEKVPEPEPLAALILRYTLHAITRPMPFSGSENDAATH